MYAVNIVSFVDVIGALSKSALRDHICLADDGWCSERKGTADLETGCYPGQLINWTVQPIDVQTPVAISQISFLDNIADQSADLIPRPWIEGQHPTYWSGFVPALAPGRYGYRLELQLGRGARSLLSIDTLSLHVHAFGEPELRS